VTGDQQRYTQCPSLSEAPGGKLCPGFCAARPEHWLGRGLVSNIK